MSKEIEKYSDLIEQLKSVVNEPDYHHVFNDLTRPLSKPNQFLIKMEMRRLARPCDKAIDLREHMGSGCTQYEHEGVVHYLDRGSQAVFERQVKAFGNYTVGVYEAVLPMDLAGNILIERPATPTADEPEKAEDKTPKPHNNAQEDIAAEYVVETFDFANTVQRSDERMNYIVAVELVAPNNQIIVANTMDVSVSGIKVKTLDDAEYRLDTRYSVFFRGLENEFSLDRKQGIYYKLVKYERTKEDHQLALMRDGSAPNPQFDNFLMKFIQGNKRRYKVNIENTLNAIKSKTFEQYYIPYFSSVPIFVEYRANQFMPTMILTNDNNKDSIYYWTNDESQMILSQVLTSERIKDLLEHPQHETYMYAYNHLRDNNLRFYTATHQELERKRQLRNVFIGFGSRKASWRIFKLQITAIKPEQCHRPLSVPDSVNENIKKQNAPPSPRLMSRLQNLNFVLLLTDVTDAAGTQAYQRRHVVRDQLPAIQSFANTEQGAVQPIPLYRFKYQSLRGETRYQMRSKAIVKWRDSQLTGVTEDVSAGGMSLELSEEFAGDKLSIVEITLPDLQKLSKTWQLLDLKYEVRFISRDKKVIKLKTFQEKAESGQAHVGSQFFNNLIRTNKSKLKSDSDQEDIPGIGEALRNIYCSNVLNVGFFILKDGIYFHPHAMTKPGKHNRLLNLLTFGCETKTTASLYPLYASSGKYKKFLAETLRKLKAKSPPIIREIFISFNPHAATQEEAINTWFIESFKNDNERKKFIVKAMASGYFYAIRLHLSRTGRPDQDVLRTELGYVSIYAPHKAKELEEELWRIAGTGDIVDVTDEAMRRYGFTEQEVSQNQGLDKQILVQEQE